MIAGSLAAAVWATTLCGALAEEDEFYVGKTVTIIVGYSAGGGYDQYARLLARHFGRHIPGHPNVLVQNMPGAATLTAVRALASAPKDGTTITMFDPGLLLESLSTPEKFGVKFSDYQWLGGMSREITVCYSWHGTGIVTWDDMMKRKEFLVGLTARGSAVYANGAALRRIFNAPVRQIAGYPGSNEQRLAVERGEIDGACASWSAIPQDWIANRKINVLARFGPQRPSEMPASVPYINDLAATEEQKALLDVLNAPGLLGRPFIVAKEVPRAREQVLVASFAATLRDGALLAEAEKQTLPIELFSAENAEKIIKSIYAISPELIKMVKDVID
jgi:tripartite-type tricarboxylate transporter receptor subunit TctC